MTLSEAILRFRWPLIAVVLICSIGFGIAAVPVQFDFSFTTLFVGDGGDTYTNLRGYVDRFGSDVNQLALILETDDVYTPAILEELDRVTEEMGWVAGYDRVLSLSNAERLVGDGVSLNTVPLVPSPIPSDPEALAQLRADVASQPQVGDLLVASDARSTVVLLKMGVESREHLCVDGVDNNGNGLIDCQDRLCALSQDFAVCGNQGAEADGGGCLDDVDNDDDGQLDCADSDCAGQTVCVQQRASAEPTSEQLCFDGTDNDGDGRTDCLDRDCQRLEGPACEAVVAVVQIRDRSLERLHSQGISANYHLAGVPYVQSEYVRTVRTDLQVHLPLLALAVAAMLFLLFRATRGVVLPGAVVGLAILWTIGAMMVAGEHLNMINSVIPTLILVIGVADSIHILSRYEDEARVTEDPKRAVTKTLQQMLAACSLTSLTSAVGFASLVSASLPIVRGFGFFAALGIGFAFVMTMSILPIALYQMRAPRRLARTPDTSDRSTACGQPPHDRLIQWGFERLLKYPRRIGLICALGILGMCGGILLVHQDSNMMGELREGSPAQIGNTFIEEHLFGVLSNAIVFEAQVDNGLTEPGALRAIEEVSQWAEDYVDPNTGLHGVSHAISVVDVLKEANRAYSGDPERFRVPETAARAFALLEILPRDLRGRFISLDYQVGHVTLLSKDIGTSGWNPLRQELEHQVTEALQRHGVADQIDFYITGSSTLAQEAIGNIVTDLISSIGLAFAVILVLMSLLFRSVKIGLMSMIPNVLPLACTLGLIGYLGIPLRISTVIIFSVSLGIAVDDTIHFLVRFREEQSHGLPYEEALRRTMKGTGRAILFTTVLLVTGFATLTFSDFVAVYELGVLGSFTLTVALIADLVVLPLILLWLRPDLSQRRVRSPRS